MKARQGELIVCNCIEPIGKFRFDVEDQESITSEDIAISAPPPQWSDNLYICSTCHSKVAEMVGGTWRVRTRNGWIE